MLADWFYIKIILVDLMQFQEIWQYSQSTDCLWLLIKIDSKYFESIL